MKASLAPDSYYQAILGTLREHPDLAWFSLAIHIQPAPRPGIPPKLARLCDPLGEGFGCRRPCKIAALRRSDLHPEQAPIVFRCFLGLLGFAIPLSRPGWFLTGKGVRLRTINLSYLEELSRRDADSSFQILQRISRLPVLTEEQVRTAAGTAVDLIATQLETRTAPAPAPEVELRAIVTVAAALDSAPGPEQALNTFVEAMGILFDVPSLVILEPLPGGREHALRPVWGPPMADTTLPATKVERLLRDQKKVSQLSLAQLNLLLPDHHAAAGIISFGEGGGQRIALCLGKEFRNGEELLAELLADRLTARLRQLRREEELTDRSEVSERLMAMISELALLDSMEELLDRLLRMAAELLDATCGSVMLLDEERVAMRIEAALRMGLTIARSLPLRVGEGIAGRVAASGQPLLVNDIERDGRVAPTNRPRFRTKSFISVPLAFKGDVFGVLNLSDKRDNRIFVKEDLEILSTLTGHAAAIIHRSRQMARTELLEQLSITDPLTELYNRRFLEKRMHEELSRCMRQDQPLTVMLIDLDHFKCYNDSCGHMDGDLALKKTSRILRACVREMDVVTRFGGEEFCILLPGTTKEEALTVAERIRHGIEQEPIRGEELLPGGRLTSSIGLASFPGDGTTAHALLHAADVALYRAKNGGRNRTTLFHPEEELWQQKIALRL
jgi:diguanylate cyclase (GGDEF)-like protein